VLLGIRTTGSILPGGNNIWDLGSPTQYFRELYSNTILTTDIIGSTITVNNITASSNITASNIIANNFTGIFNGALSSSAQIATDISGAFTSTSASFASSVASNLSSINTKSSIAQLNASSSALQANIDTKASITQLNTSSSALQANLNTSSSVLQINIGEKASIAQLNVASSALQTNIDAKASITQLNTSSSALQTNLNTSSSALQTNIDAKASITQLNTSSSALQTNLNTSSSALQINLNTLSSSLQANINTKASIVQLNASSSALQANIDEKASIIQLNASSSALQININTKSSITQLNTSSSVLQTNLNTSSSALQANIDEKASITQLNTSSSALQANIDTKASITQLNTSSSALQTNIDTKASIVQLNASSSALQTNLNTSSSALQTNLNTSSSALQTNIDAKASIAQLNTSSSALQTNLNTSSSALQTNLNTSSSVLQTNLNTSSSALQANIDTKASIAQLNTSSSAIISNISGAFTSTSASVALDIVNNAANTFKTTGQRNGTSGITGSLHLTGSTSDLRVDGTIGIGTAAPTANNVMMHVKSNYTGLPTVIIEGDNGNSNANLEFKNTDISWVTGLTGGGYSDSFLIRSSSDDALYPFAIDPSAGSDAYHPLLYLENKKVSILGNINANPDANLLVSGNLFISGPNGHITASGNISADGTGSFGYIETSGLFNHTNDDNTGLEFSSDTVIIQGNGVHAALFSSNVNILNVPTTINDDLTVTGSIDVSGNIIGNINATNVTASGNISASGNIIGNIDATNVTASGNISASALVEGIGFRTSGNSGFGGQVHVGGTTVSSFNTGQIFKATGTSEFTGDITGSSKLLIQKSSGEGTPVSETSDVAIFQNNTSGQDASIAIIAADEKSSQIHFGRYNNIKEGSIKYNHSSSTNLPDTLQFRIGNTPNVIGFAKDAGNRGKIGVGDASRTPTDFFHAQGTLSGGGLTVSSSNGGTILLKSANTKLTLERKDIDDNLKLEFNTTNIDATGSNWTLGNIIEEDNNLYIYSGDNKINKHVSFISSSSTIFYTNITASNNISASGNIYSTNVESTGTITAVSGAFSYITASIIDVDANTIRLGGSPFSKTDVDSLRAGKMPEQTAKEGFTNRLQPEAIFGKHDSDYIKFTTGHRIGTFISGTLFHDMNLTGSSNYFAVGKDSNTQLRLTGQITASSHISSSGTITANKGVFGVDSSEQPRVIINPTGQITASGNISSSGIVKAGLLQVEGMHGAGVLGSILTFGDEIYPTAVDGSTIHLRSNITASGNISSSGTIISDNSLTVNRQYFEAYGGSNIHLSKVGSNLALTNGGLTTSQITASGDISSSNASTASFGSMKLTNLPTTKPTTTGSLWLSGSNAEGTSKYLMVFTG
jgi:hypothetical protein